MKMIIGMEKSGKILENCNVTWKIQVYVTLLITDAFVNFVAVHDTKHLKLRFQKFESHSVFGIEEYIYKFQRLKANSVMFMFT